MTRIERRKPDRQIADFYAAQIYKHEIKAGERLPGRTTIAGRWGVNPMTAQRALRMLVDAGLAWTDGRRGTFALGPEAATSGGPLLS